MVACFEFEGVDPEEAQYSVLTSLLEISNNVIVIFCIKDLPRFLSLLPCCIHVSVHV